MAKKVVAIDGPAGSGKSTTAKLVAQRLNFLYLDTGAMYRAITLKALENGVDVNDEEKLEKLTENSVISFKKEDGIDKIFLNGKDVTEKIRGTLVDQNVSFVSMHKKIRKILVEKQKEIGRRYDLVAEGRDTTSVVFPHAFKIYLCADIKERAKRRFLELKNKGIQTSVEEQIKEIAKRDKLDSEREASPLCVDKEAVVVDTTHLTIEEQVNKVIELYKDAGRVSCGSALQQAPFGSEPSFDTPPLAGDEVQGRIKKKSKGRIPDDKIC
jgi:cytidylate kinase